MRRGTDRRSPRRDASHDVDFSSAGRFRTQSQAVPHTRPLGCLPLAHHPPAQRNPMPDPAEHSATDLSPTELPAAGHAPGLGANKLGVIAIAFFVIAAAAPMAAVIGASPVLFVAVGPATPIIYLLAALIIAVFSVGYLRMSRHITNAGGFVAYIA